MKAALVAAAAVIVSMVPLSGTSYAASCSGAGCDNKGPKATGCREDATTVKKADDNFHRVELRWSTTCMAGWVRGSHVTSGSDWWPKYAHIEKRAAPSTSSPVLKDLYVKIPDNSGSDWSNMLGGNNYYYRACLEDNGDLTCTGFF
ncbi:DUF2690 domain-containing protein [Streptomyces sparsogenes]|uniref:DUF2690 domain-containing protein n=1 Tax=Streptomyces sparsogenes TaxID=67365 RepID=UPI00340E63AC